MSASCVELLPLATQQVLPLAAQHEIWAFPGWSTIAIALSASVGLVAVIVARATSRQRAALDFIIRTESEDFYQDVKASFKELEKTNSLKTILTPHTARHQKDRHAVQSYLNHYEQMAIAIFQGSIDEQFCKAYKREWALEDWKAAEELIFEVRRIVSANGGIDYNQSDLPYFYFEKLVERWEQRPKRSVLPWWHSWFGINDLENRKAPISRRMEIRYRRGNDK